MDAVNNITKDITIILIAHRLTTLSKCDNIIKLKKGEIMIEMANYLNLVNLR